MINDITTTTLAHDNLTDTMSPINDARCKTCFFGYVMTEAKICTMCPFMIG
jgi:hypothetical protein